MLRTRIDELRNSFSDIFNLRDDEAKGRTINLVSTLLTALFNVFITGIFYTGYLTMYGMTITDSGILTFIPYIACLFSVFSPKVLSKFKRRKFILLITHIYFYFMYIIATNIMPLFVTDTQQRMIWFSVILFLAYSVDALFSPGRTTWFYHFFPADTERRTHYLTMLQLFSAVMSSVTLIVSSLIADAVAGSAYQDMLIVGLRYFAFVLVVIDVLLRALAKDYVEEKETNLKIKDIFTLPFKYKKFICCMGFMFFWNYLANLNNGLWSYHQLNHLGLSYTLITSQSVLYPIFFLLLSGPWRKVLRRYSWIKTFGIACIMLVPMEFLYFIMKPGQVGMFLVIMILQNMVNVGLNLSYANVLYMNLPEENSTAHISFYQVGVYLFAFLSLITGTAISSATGDTTKVIWGLEMYSVQFTCFAKTILLFGLGVFLICKWRAFTNNKDIEAVLQIQAEHRLVKLEMLSRKVKLLILPGSRKKAAAEDKEVEYW